MHFIFNNKKLKSRRRSLRKTQTDVESILWSRLRNKQMGVKFYRQYSAGPFIMDFYCPKKKLGVELDGYQHLGNVEYDISRTQYLNSLGIEIIRFWNSEVVDNLDEVVDKISKFLTPLCPS